MFHTNAVITNAFTLYVKTGDRRLWYAGPAEVIEQYMITEALSFTSLPHMWEKFEGPEIIKHNLKKSN